MFSDVLAYIGDHIAAIITGVLIVAFIPIAKWFGGWYWVKKKQQNPAYLEWQISFLQEHSMLPFFVIEARTLKMLKTNKALRRLFSTGKESFEGKSWYRLIHNHDRQEFLTAMRAAIADQSNFTYECSVVLPDNTELEMLWVAEPFIELGSTRALGGTVSVISKGEWVKGGRGT